MKTSQDNTESKRRVVRVALAILIAVLVVSYIGGVVTGYIDKDSQLDTTHIALIIIAAVAIQLILQPRTIKGLELIEWGSLKVRMREIRNEVDAQRENLAIIEEIFPFLLNEYQRNHLLNLLNHKTENYKGGHALRNELRQLRSMGLIETIDNQWISSIKDKQKVDLSQYVQLTEKGKYWTQRFAAIENNADDSKSGASDNSKLT